MLNAPALTSLAHQLGRVVATFKVQASELGHPEFVRKAADEAAQLFQEFASARPSKEDAYAAASSFLRGQRLDDEGLHFLASALNMRVKEANGRRALAGEHFPALLETYRREAKAGNLWLLTWFGLLCSYFEFSPQGSGEQVVKAWEGLRALLQETWPAMSREAGTDVVPDWVTVLRSDPDLLGENAADRYGLEYLNGDDTRIRRLSIDLGIPESSWFWHAVVLSAVRRSTEQPDKAFKESIPKLLTLIQARPVYRDEALVAVLTRYHQCSEPARHVLLRDYVVRKDVWRNPKLRAAGLATSWTRVDDSVWRMVLQWVNEANLKDFFAVLAARRNSDEGRLEFWSQYLEQISWTRLIFSSQTRYLAYSNEAIRNLIAREEDSYATLSTNADVDAFMMQLGEYIIVEFSRVPNAAYAYKADELPFEPYAREYTGTMADLKAGFHGEHAARILHKKGGWENEAAAKLRRLGIFPDESRRDRQRVTRQPPANRERATTVGPDARLATLLAETATSQPPADSKRANKVDSDASPVTWLKDASVKTDSPPKGAPFTMQSLRALLSGFGDAYVLDKRRDSGGRLWVGDPRQRPGLDSELKKLGFQWASGLNAWYYPEN